jgi:hypothetical protein
MTKNGLGKILGAFFTNSSGHPDAVRHLKEKQQLKDGLMLWRQIWPIFFPNIFVKQFDRFRYSFFDEICN